MYVFSNLVIRRTNAGDAVSIRVVKETADYYGWSEAFEDYTKSRKDFLGDRYNAFCPSLGKGALRGGRRHRICRDPSKKGMPAGKTNCFRIVGPWSRKDFVQLAVVAGDKFEWMEGQYGERISREDWLALAS